MRGTVLGLVSLYRTEQAGSFDELEVSFALGIAAHAAASIDNARLHTREHTIAAIVQRQLLPARPVSQTAIESATTQVFAEEGGGVWCAFALDCARTALVIGEVSGYGLQAAATTGQLRTVIRSLASLDLEADEMLARLNDTALLLAAESAALPPSDPGHRQPLTASGVYAIYDPLAQTCTYARAGHPAPVIVSPDGTLSKSLMSLPGLSWAPMTAFPSRSPPSSSTPAASSPFTPAPSCRPPRPAARMTRVPFTRP